MNTIGENIAYLRKQKKMTQEELAEKMSVTPQAVSKWECNSSYPDMTVMHTLAKTLGVSVDNILGEAKDIPTLKETTKEKIDRRIVHIKVSVDETMITTRFPVSAVKKAIENGTLEKLVGEDAYEEVANVLGMIDAGITGPFVDVDTPEAHICIAVGDYEN